MTLLASSTFDPGAPVASSQSEDLRLEPVGPEHAESLVRLFERNFGTAVSANFDPFPLTAARAREIALAERADVYYVAVRDGCLLGMSMLRGFDDGYKIPTFGIFVDNDSHGQGLGRALTAWTVEQARRRNCPAVRLTVYVGNLAARRIYESLGFIELERQRVDRAGRPDEKIVMRLNFGG